MAKPKAPSVQELYTQKATRAKPLCSKASLRAYVHKLNKTGDLLQQLVGRDGDAKGLLWKKASRG